jgi:DNA invertase Pin-like site-specific DNA recombinase
MKRVALYARYSSENQRDASIEDQLRLCREHAERQGWEVVDSYSDRAISGASLIRPGIQELMHDAHGGRFNVVLAEAMDRLSRDQEDVAAVYKRLMFAGVKIVTLSEGEVSELHVGLKGTMNALFLKDLADKTRRGLRGRVAAGKSGGGLCYGYDVVRSIGPDGTPITGDRRINPAEAAVVQHVFRAFAANTSPRRIVRQLNAEAVPGPFGKVWGETTIRGHVKRGTGLLNNELYIGRLVWNRLRYTKDPNTGKRVSRLNPPSTWVITEVPELRIIDDELWEAVKARQREIEEQHAPAIEAVREAHKRNRLRGAQRPRYLLSGLLFCGCCGGPVALRGQDRYACSKHVNSGTCTNTRSIRRERLEARVLEGLKERLLAPEVAAEAMRAYAEEMNRLNRERRLSVDGDRRALADVERKIKDVVTVIENGGYKPALLDRLDELELQRGRLRERLARVSATPPDVHPNVSEIFRAKVARLAETLNDPVDRAQAAQAIRSLIERVVLLPDPDSGEIKATLEGELGTILGWVAQQTTNTGRTRMRGVSVSVVAGARFGRCHTAIEFLVAG